MKSKTAQYIVAYPGTGHFAQQVALTLLQAGALQKFVTTFAVLPERVPMRQVLRLVPASVRRQLLRRQIDLLPTTSVATRPFFELARTLAVQVGASPPMIDRIWDRMAHDFSRHVARRWVGQASGIYAYEYTALEPFRRAKAEGRACVLDLPSLSSRLFQELLEKQRRMFPETRSRHDAYFDRLFPQRQARRDEEIALADVIVTNSRLTAQSHIQHGADPGKVITVPLAAPPAIAHVPDAFNVNSPVRAIWAGTFSLGKGAHILLEAWRQGLRNCPSLELHVFGRITVPTRLLQHCPDNIHFHGAVPQEDLFKAFEKGDILLFPTLSDGFGMVVLEAFSRALPVITTARAGAAEMVEHEKNGLIIEAESSSAIIEAMQWCLDNRQRLHMMRHHALQTAKSWQWPDYRRKLAQQLDKALRKAGFDGLFDTGR